MGDRRPRALDPAAVSYGPDGLVAAVVQDAARRPRADGGLAGRRGHRGHPATGEAHFHSRSRDALWKKGETSGNTLAVVSHGARLRRRRGAHHGAPGGAHLSHRGALLLRRRSRPGGRSAAAPAAAQDFAWLERLWGTIEERARTRPEGSYTSTLLDEGVDATARKVAEEATEVVMAAKDDEVAERGRRAAPRGAGRRAGRPALPLAGALRGARPAAGRGHRDRSRSATAPRRTELGRRGGPRSGASCPWPPTSSGRR